MSRIRTGTAGTLALALSLAFVPVVSAGSIGDSFSVATVLEVSGIPATISYGTVAANVTSSPQSVTATVVSNSGWKLTMSGSDFSGPATIGKAAREAQVDQPAFGGPPGGLPWTNFGSPTLDGSTTVVTGPSAGGSVSFGMSFRVTPPPASLPGAYSGTITYTFTATP